MVFRKRGICLLLVLALCMCCMPGAVFAAEETTDSTQETTQATEETTQPTEESSEPTEETSQPTEETIEPTQETTLPTEPVQPIQVEPKGWGLYFGQLHAHSSISDGAVSAEVLYTQAAGAGLDFFAVTDRGESISGAAEATLNQPMEDHSPDWAAGKTAATAATNRDFVGMYGFEMCWPREKNAGHIVGLNTPGFANWQQPAYSEAGIGPEAFASAMTQIPGAVGQFCHPGPLTGDFLGFTQYSAAMDQAVQLLEVGTGRDFCRYYTQALDYGWHVAPTCNQTSNYDNWGDFSVGRTVIQADSLTEQGLCAAIRNHRVYATQDADLQIYFDQLGSRLARRNVGPELELKVRLYDPTDAIGLVEVVVTAGEVIASAPVEGSSAELTFAVPSNYPYYYLKITQPDGDLAVTAPVWLEGEADVGIRDFSCSTNLPLQGKPVDLNMTLVNGDTVPLLVEKMEFFLDGEVFHTADEISSLLPGEEAHYAFSPTLFSLGVARITAVITATLEGQPRMYEKTITLHYRRDDMVTDILVDAAHENAGLEQLNRLEVLAADNRLGLVYAREEVTREMLAEAAILLITAPEEAFSDAFLRNVAEFAQHGGILLLCGRGDDPQGTAQLNALLQAADSGMQLHTDTALDSVHNGGQPDWLYPVNLNRADPWMKTLSENQYYRHISGCTVSGGTWLVKGYDTTQSSTDGRPAPVLLAWEGCGEGTIFAGGSLWLTDENLAPGKNIWDEPYANRNLAEAILGIAPPEIPLKQIQSVRQGENGDVCRIRGYVTAGTSRPGNRFPDTIYLQDDTAGIAVSPFEQEEIPLGTALEITGYLETVGKNKQFHPISVQLLDSSPYRFAGATGEYAQVMNPALLGGSLVQVEGVVQRIQLTQENVLSQMVLWDQKTGYATVLVEPYIVSGSDGENHLALDIREGQEVRALGILHLHEDGTAVVRVRNCDEVIVIDPWPYTPDRPRPVRDKTNPSSGDSIGFWLVLLVVSGGLLPKKRLRYPH